jgi:hypothetical protein
MRNVPWAPDRRLAVRCRFSEFLDACRHEVAPKQAVFQQRVQGGARWFYDMTDLSLTIDDIVLGMTPIGTYSSEYGSWLWAWANEDFPLAARQAAERIKTLHDITGFQVFLDPGIKASPADADDFVALAVHALDAAAFFRCPPPGPTLYLAVHDLRPSAG